MLDVRNIDINEFKDKCLNMYISLFPQEERKRWNFIEDAYNKGVEKFYIIELDKLPIGFFMMEHLDNHPYYLEYIGIIENYQNKNYGTKALNKLIDYAQNDGIICEIEDINSSELSRKRLDFYQRLGFIWEDHLYNLYTVLYNPVAYNYDGDITAALFDYYLFNMGAERLKKNCKIIK